MNITQALNVALPELPAKMVSQRYPRVHSGVVFKEHIEEGQLVIRAFVPGADLMFTFPPESWKLIQLFDGHRSFADVAQLYSRETGVEYSEDTVRDFAAEVDGMNFWYKTPLEKNVKLMQKTADERRRLQKKKNKWGDLSMITFPAVNPDRFLTWLHDKIGFIYKPWFVALTLLAFAFTAGVFITHWSEVGRDTWEFYNFAHKSWFDVAVFWIIGAVLLCIHETGHGLTTKHYGAHVPAMGFLLIYLTPAFYTDTTQGEVLGDRFQRLMITVSGVWAELMVCSLATPIWWGTPPGTAIHDFAYTIILLTGFAVVLINWNPLIKLDGYWIVTDLLGVTELKESSTLYLSSWVKRNIWGLPVEVPKVPKRRRPAYVVYAILSGLYSYSILYIFASFIGNIARNFSADWGFLFEYGTAYLIFRGRIRTLGSFMKFVYLDKRDGIRAWFTPARKLSLGAAGLVFVFLPLWHESATGRFVLEPANSTVVRALVPGIVTGVYADEGQQVAEGALLLQLRNLALDSKLARSQSDRAMAVGRAERAVLHYADVGSTEQERDRLIRQTEDYASEAARLEVTTPIAGVVTTPRVSDQVGRYVPEGTELAEVADLSRLRARIYVSEFEMYKLKEDSPARLQIDGMVGRHDARTVAVTPTSTEISPGLTDLSKYQGQRAPRFYVFDLLVDNAGGSLRPGMAGTARVYGQRRSLAGLALQQVEDFIGRKMW
ncbi:MAG: HlyD family efflux transporter periplasmic adaptor subunit [Terriglobales bacterium]|jgi:putative peptide zinc metalloprotease protein